MGLDWYKEGLRFKCTECGQCCTGAPGYVWLTDEDIDQLTKGLKISREDFLKKYTRTVNGRISLIEDPETFDCVFLKDNKCSQYKTRPKQCRTFPWWKDNLRSKAAWENTAKRCEGINHPDAPLISHEDISKEI